LPRRSSTTKSPNTTAGASWLRAKDIPKAKEALVRAREDRAGRIRWSRRWPAMCCWRRPSIPPLSQRFESALTRYPNKMQLIHDYPEALIKAGRPADAFRVRGKGTVRFPAEGPLHEIAARAYAAQDKRLKQHEHQGEYYAWIGNLPLAVTQYRAGHEIRRRRLLPTLRGGDPLALHCARKWRSSSASDSAARGRPADATGQRRHFQIAR
jgi:hypothetical protein